jgi:low affinity Fe/Cu permease
MLFVVRNDVLGLKKMKQKRISTTKDTKGHEKRRAGLIDLISCNFVLFVVRNDVLGLKNETEKNINHERHERARKGE